MFRSDDLSKLICELEVFQVPMFVAERIDDAGFRLLALNKCNSAVTGLEQDAIQGRRIDTLLPKGEARVVNGRYDTCCRDKKPLEYQEDLTISGMQSRWRTVLIPVVSETKRDRVVGNSVNLRIEHCESQTQRVFEEINYYAVQSQFQLARTSSYLEALDERCRAELSWADREVLMGLLRTATHTLNNVRSIAEPRRNSANGTGLLPGSDTCDQTKPSARYIRDPVRKSLQDLSNLIEPLH